MPGELLVLAGCSASPAMGTVGAPGAHIRYLHCAMALPLLSTCAWGCVSAWGRCYLEIILKTDVVTSAGA